MPPVDPEDIHIAGFELEVRRVFSTGLGFSGMDIGDGVTFVIDKSDATEYTGSEK